MSRIGKMPVPVPAGVDIKSEADGTLFFAGTAGGANGNVEKWLHGK